MVTGWQRAAGNRRAVNIVDPGIPSFHLAHSSVFGGSSTQDGQRAALLEKDVFTRPGLLPHAPEPCRLACPWPEHSIKHHGAFLKQDLVAPA